MAVGVLGLAAPASCSNDADTPIERVLPSVVPSDLAAHARQFIYAEEPGAGSWTLFGRSGSDPFGAQDALVEVVLQSSDPPIEGAESVRGGHPASFSEHSVPGGSMRSLTWNEGNSSLVTVRSFTLDKAQLMELAEGLTITGDRVTSVASPAELHVVGVVPLPIYTSGYSVTYESGDRSLHVDVHTTSGDELLQYRWAGGVPTTVDGRDVIQLLAARGATPGYIFEYRPGLTVLMNGSVSDEELRAAVASLQPISADQLAAILTS